MTHQNATKIVLLGTGNPNANPERSGPSVAILVNESPYIVDFGPGVVRRASAAGLKMADLTKAFLTHLHSDHTVGLPDLIFTPWVLGRETPLEIYGPVGIRSMTEHIISAYQADISERINGLEPANREGYKLKVNEFKKGIFYENSDIKIEAFPVKHGIWKAYGFKFHTPDKVICISGDTAPDEKLVKYYRGCDILIHEVYSSKGFKNLPPPWKKYHSSVHTSTYELAKLAAYAKPKLLVLYHQLFWGVSEEELLYEIKERYEGVVISGKDLQIFT
ncbi:MAG: MBL fold metallo-hydrolase [Candidatus Thorarchaeota archaeon]